MKLNTELNSEASIQKATEKPENWAKQNTRKLNKERVKFYNWWNLSLSTGRKVSGQAAMLKRVWGLQQTPNEMSDSKARQITAWALVEEVWPAGHLRRYHPHSAWLSCSQCWNTASSVGLPSSKDMLKNMGGLPRWLPRRLQAYNLQGEINSS